MGSKETEMRYCVRGARANLRGLNKIEATLTSGTVPKTLYKCGKHSSSPKVNSKGTQGDYRSLVKKSQ